MHPFIMHPERIALVAILLLVVSICFSTAQRRAWPTIIAGAGWAVFAMWEWYCKSRGYNIRIDLLVIAPVLYALTAWGLLSMFWRRNAVSTDCDEF